MENHLNLLGPTSREKRREKRRFPRVPFSFLTFKSLNPREGHVFEVRDISHSGMRLCLKDGAHGHRAQAPIEGELRLKDLAIGVQGRVVWADESGLGVSFEGHPEVEGRLREFLEEEKGPGAFRPLHEVAPATAGGPKYWYKSDRGSELLVWAKENGGIVALWARLPGALVEWREEAGLGTGTPLYLREAPEALSGQEEYLVEFDVPLDFHKVAWAQSLVAHLAKEYLPEEVGAFLLGKISHRAS